MIKTILKILGVLLLVAAIAVIFNWEKIKRVQRTVSLFDKENIVDNFFHMENYFWSSELTASATPTLLPSNINHQLPSSFTSDGQVIDVQQWMKRTMTTGLMIIHKDTIVFEQYFNGLTPKQTHISWSMAKSFVSALMGMAVEEGKIASIEDPITKYLPQFEKSGYNNVRIKDILQMSSGVRFNEDYSDYNSDINKFGRTMAAGASFESFALGLVNENPPGTKLHYVSIDTQVLGMLLAKVNGKNLTELLKEKIWDPMGMEHNAQWLTDSEDMEMALGGLNSTLRDFAKFGLLYLHQGNWQGKQLVAKDWVTASVTPDAPHLQPGENDLSETNLGYGYQWWIPENADGAFLASGIYNQHIFIQPNRDVVVVKLSANYHFKDQKDQEKNQHIHFLQTVAKQFPKKVDVETPLSMN